MILLVLLVGSVMATDEANKAFDLVSDVAARSLKAFARQSGVEVLIGANLGREVRTHAVKGRMTPREAIDAMLRETGLVAVQDGKSGAFAIRKDAGNPSVDKGAQTTRGSRPRKAAKTDGRSAAARVPVVQLQKFVSTGTRFNGRTVADSPVPIDYISGNELRTGGYTELNQMLKAKVPSFSLPRPATAGSVDITSAPALRGLSPGQLLVLINGKRRHSSGDLNVNQQIGRGDVAYDFNAIPAAALSHIEVLRDGAAAQYGSDAIAGVINLVLDKSVGAGINSTFGVTAEGDGKVSDTAAYVGVPFLDRGVVRATVFYNDHGYTDRSRPDTRQQYFGSNGTTTNSGFFGSGTGVTPANGTLDPREATFDRHTFRFGDPDYVNKGLFLNGELPTSRGVTIYAFGGYSQIVGASPGFYRRAGDDTVVRGLWPNGFLPMLTLKWINASVAAGIKGEGLGGWAWDLSTVYGGSKMDSGFIQSNNASLGQGSPTSFFRGRQQYYQWTTNFDLAREFSFGDSSPLKVALGAERREEYYQLFAGEPSSYLDGGIRILDGPNAGRVAPVGSQHSPGYFPADATDKTRSSIAAYVDTEKQMTSRLLISAAARFEHYTDFGDSSTYKMGARFQVAKPFALRASVSTGFRAPQLAQSWFSSTSTTFINGAPVVFRLFPVSNPVAQLLGSSPLKPEKSTNQSVGITYDQGPLSVTVDAYRITLRDRIALSSQFQDARITTLLAANGYPNVGAVSYLTNAVDTQDTGLDVTARYRHSLSDESKVTFTLGALLSKTEFDRIAPTPKPLSDLGILTPLFDLTQQVRYTASQPKNKYILGVEWEWKKFTLNLNNIRYGEVQAVVFTSLTPARAAVITQGYDVRLAPTDPASANQQVVQTFAGKVITDLDLTYRLNRQIAVTLGVNNLLDVYPDENIKSTVAGVAVGTNGADNAGTIPYNYVSPWGWNGAFFYGKFSYKF